VWLFNDGTVRFYKKFLRGRDIKVCPRQLRRLRNYCIAAHGMQDVRCRSKSGIRIKNMVTVTCEGDGKWYMQITFKAPAPIAAPVPFIAPTLAVAPIAAVAAPARQVLPKPAAAVDPGVRCEATVFDTTGAVTQIGHQGMSRIVPMMLALDRIASEHARSKLNSHGRRARRRRRRLRKAAARLWWRIQCLIKDNHIQVAKFMVEQYSCIIWPRFETQQMISRRRFLPS
jgi:hypothetical protein